MDEGADRTAGQSTCRHQAHGREGTLNPQVRGSSPRGYNKKALVSTADQGLRSRTGLALARASPARTRQSYAVCDVRGPRFGPAAAVSVPIIHCAAPARSRAGPASARGGSPPRRTSTTPSKA
jgi:hypothetical protein